MRRAFVTGSAAALLIITASACGPSSHPSASNTTSASPTSGGSPGPTSDTGHLASVAMTTPNGYQFAVRLAKAGVTTMTSFTTDDGSGSGGTTENAPTGSELLVAQIVFTNNSGRAEPLVLAPVSALPVNASNSQLDVAVPDADYAAFGIDKSSADQICNTASGTDTSYQDVTGYPTFPPPRGYCYLPTLIGAFSPAQSDITRPPQVAPGADGTITLLVTGAANGLNIPQRAPLAAVRVFAESTVTCNCWSALN